MIIDAQYIRLLRPTAGNIEEDRISVYIDEAEKLDVMPAIGAEEYERLSAICDGGDGELTEEEKKLLNGGYYDSPSCGRGYLGGLKKAVGYLAYARFVRNHPAQITPFGVVVKTGDDSTPADSRTVAAIANDALTIGNEHLQAAVKYWKAVNGCACSTAKEAARRKFIKIGD